MTPKTQLATTRLIWEVEVSGGPYVGEVAQFGISLGIQRADDKWNGSTPSYRGRSGQVRDEWHDVTTSDYTATVAWECDLDDGVGVLGAVTQADLLAEMNTFATALLPSLSSLAKFNRLIIAPHQQTGAQSHGSGGGAVASTVATYLPAKGVGTGTGMLPPEVAVAVSLYGIGNRRKSRGRFYFGPVLPIWMTQTGIIGSTYLDTLRTKTADLLKALILQPATDNGSQSGDRFIPWVHNPSGDALVGGNPPTGSPIASVRTDDRPDSQRRRESRYTPAKSITPVSGW